MKIKIIHKNSGIDESEHSLFNDFLHFLQKNYPLKKDIEIYFLKNRVGDMTTGRRNDNHHLLILTSGRLNRDIIRTVAHEWVHEYQHTIQNKKKGKNIGGPLEDEANAKSGELIKKFERYYPKHMKSIYKSHEKFS